MEDEGFLYYTVDLEFISLFVADKISFLERFDFLILDDLVIIWLDQGLCVYVEDKTFKSRFNIPWS